jgi:hypothetical protein
MDVRLKGSNATTLNALFLRHSFFDATGRASLAGRTRPPTTASSARRFCQNSAAWVASHKRRNLERNCCSASERVKNPLASLCTRASNQAVMSGRVMVSFVDFSAFSFDFDDVRRASTRSFLVRNWCGPQPIVDSAGGQRVGRRNSAFRMRSY